MPKQLKIAQTAPASVLIHARLIGVRLRFARKRRRITLRELAYKEGMKPLRISAAMKVAAGLTTIEEAIKVAPPPQRDSD